jgi:Fe-S-cluster-containing dehydrogenase component
MSGHILIRRRRAGPDGPDRREALALMAAASAAALASCGRPNAFIVPFADFDGDAASGAPVRYATSLELSGYGVGVVGVVANERPIKVEGNPRHPTSLGSTTPFLEAAVLDLFDPQRSKTPMNGLAPTDWATLGETLRRRVAFHAADRGAGFALLTGRILSPTLLAQVAALQKALPAMTWARWEPIHDDAQRAGSELAYGRALDLRPRLDRADVIVALDSDFLGPGPDQIALARGFASRRRPEAGPMSRLYVLESALTPTGVMADRREAARPELIHNAAIALAATLGGPLTPPPLPTAIAQFVAQAARDLTTAGAGLVLAGPSQAPEVHALACWINGQARAPIDMFVPLDPATQGHAASLASLVGSMRAGKVKTLIILDSNPVFAAPPDLAFAEALRAVPFTLHAGLHRNATGASTAWHAPLSHAFESWGDARAADGTASLIQPLVAPLYDTKTAHALLAGMVSPSSDDDEQRVRRTWSDGEAGSEADGPAWWAEALASGVVPQRAATPVTGAAPRLPAIKPQTVGNGLTLVLRPSAQVWDGRFAANAWLQECPEPITKETWGASLLVSPTDGARLGLGDGQSVKLRAGSRSAVAAIRIDAQQAEGALALPLGFGEDALWPIAESLGPHAYALRGADQPYALSVELVPAAGARQPPRTQHEFKLSEPGETIYPTVTATAPAMPHPAGEPPDLLPKPAGAKPAWAMVVDNSVCIGCNACVVSCQAENTEPVIGPIEIGRNRDMHWLRIDRYALEGGQNGFEPVPCMQCEQAPCEPVCPVEASVHDAEGLNDQVYNRCIGTRFCESNCPYKVRRFNFGDYYRWPAYGDLDHRSIEAQRNPNVSVRGRGVMEKCTYCVQRISEARKTAEKEDRAIRDGEVTTACQDACPTRAISFGDLTDPTAAVSRSRANPRHFTLLEELKTRPRTTYLARAVNPAPGKGGA